MPRRLPPPHDLRIAMEKLEHWSRPLSESTLATAFAYLLALFEPGTKMSREELKTRHAAWLMACGDIPDDLFNEGARICGQTLKWMPKPMELRQAVADKIVARAMAILRVKQMREAPPPPPVGASAAERIVDPRPADMLARQATISRRRVALFGAMPENLEAWWSQIQQAAAAESLEPGTLADWKGPERPSLWRPVGASVPPAHRPPYKPPDSPSARRAAELAKAFHKPAEKPPET